MFRNNACCPSGVDLFGPEGGRDFSRWFPDHDKLFGHAQTAVGTAASVLANTLVIVFLGLLFSFDPGAYRDGVVLLVRPSSRERAGAVLDETLRKAVVKKSMLHVRAPRFRFQLKRPERRAVALQAIGAQASMETRRTSVRILERNTSAQNYVCAQ
jgi:hypothetical protein